MKIAWTSDLHLNSLSVGTKIDFYEKLVSSNADILINTGDISESDNFLNFYNELSDSFQKPIYACLGNHEFYFSSVPVLRDQFINFCSKDKYVRYLPAVQYGSSTNSILTTHWKYGRDDWGFELNEETVLYGHDGWADCRLGNENSNVMLADYRYIHELAFLPKANRIRAQRGLAWDGVQYLRETFDRFLQAGYRNMIFATHIPPFREACVYDGKVSDDQYLPHFSCRVIGDTLAKFAMDNPDKNIVVLCGHTHGRAKVQVLPNLVSYTGSFDQSRPASDYGSPQLNIFNLSDLGF